MTILRYPANNDILLVDDILPLVFLKRLLDAFDDEVDHLAHDFGGRDTAAGLMEQVHKLVRFYVPPTPAGKRLPLPRPGWAWSSPCSRARCSASSGHGAACMIRI